MCFEENFRPLALRIGKKFKSDSSFQLSPLDLYHMARNHVVLEPCPNGLFYKSRLRCLLCITASLDLDRIIAHCQEISHRHKVYQAELLPAKPAAIRSDKLFEKTEGTDVIVGSRNPVRTAPLFPLFNNANVVQELICQLCQVRAPDFDNFALHLVGFGHRYQCNRLARSGHRYFLAFFNPETKRFYLFSVTDRQILLNFDALEQVGNTCPGHSQIEQISILHPDVLREFISDLR